LVEPLREILCSVDVACLVLGFKRCAMASEGWKRGEQVEVNKREPLARVGLGAPCRTRGSRADSLATLCYRNRILAGRIVEQCTLDLEVRQEKVSWVSELKLTVDGVSEIAPALRGRRPTIGAPWTAAPWQEQHR
jgi:hypothetical protein